MSLISSKVELKVNNDLGQISSIEEICPSFVDTKNPKFLSIDNVLISTLMVTNYNKEMEGVFLDRILSADINLQMSIFYEKQDTYEVIKKLTYSIGNTGAEIKITNKNQTDMDVMSNSYEDAKYIRKELQIGGEDLYFIHIYITLFEKDLNKLEYNLQKIEGIASGVGLNVRRAIYREEQAFKSCMPTMQNDNSLKELTKRNVLTKDMVCTYPFISNELCDDEGVVLGVNFFNNSLVMLDRFDTEKYKNANMCVIGTSGSGKSYFTKIMILRNRYLNISQYIIDPDREYIKLCESLNGTLIKFDGSSNINVMDIRKTSLDEEESYLQNKISKLNTFFELVFDGLTLEEKSIFEEKIIECYKQKGITFDDNTLYKISNSNLLEERVFKESIDMPKLEDLYNIIKKDKKLKRTCLLMNPLISGSLKYLNNYTNIDISNKLVVADIHDIDDKNIPMVMYILTEFYWDKIKDKRWEKKILYLDEAWKMINNSESSANFIFKIFKTIRKYGGAATIITQDINDFFTLNDGKFGKGIINNSNIKCIFNLEENDLKLLQDVINLSEEEVYKLQSMERGKCLLYAGKNQLMIDVISSKKEHEIITTDRKDLENLKNGGMKNEKNNNSTWKSYT